MINRSQTTGSVASDAPLGPFHPSPWTIRCAGLLLVLATFVVFWNGLKGAFVFDDHILSLRLPLVVMIWPMGETYTTTSGIGGRPVLSLSFALNRMLIGAAPWHYRIVNIAIHAASGVLLFLVVRRTLQFYVKLNPRSGAPRVEGPVRSAIRHPQVPLAIAFAVAMLWLLHPLQTQSVTYIIQRAESLAGFFLLLTLYAAIRRFDGGGSAWTILAVAACLLGMGVKPTMFAAPALVLLYDYTFVSGSVRSALRSRTGLYTGLACGWVLLGVFIASWQMSDPWPELGARNPWPYARSQPGVILYYLRLAFWPDPVVPAYAWPYARTAWQIIPPLLVVGVLVCLTVWGIWRRSWGGFLGAWFFLILAPSSSFAALEQVIQCHRMYLPLAAVSVLVVLGLFTLLARIALPPVGRARMAWIAGLVMLVTTATALAWGAMRRNSVYGTELDLWEDNVARQPQSYVAQSALGSQLMLGNRPAEAELCFRKALDVDDSPEPVEAHYRLGVILFSSRRYDEALAHFEEAHTFRPLHAETVEQLGATLAALGRPADAVRQLEKALSLHPDASVAAAAHNNLGTILTTQGKLQEAATHYRLATQLQPDSPEAFGNLGSTLVQMGRFDEALAFIATAIRLAPTNADFHNNLGFALLSLNRYDEAAFQFREALRINPDHALAQRNLRTATAAGGNGAAPPSTTKQDESSSSEIPLP